MYGENFEFEKRLAHPKAMNLAKVGLLDQLFVTSRLKNDDVFERA
jgi:hypothetical protein